MSTIVVHNGTFHADDLFAVATLKKVLLSRGKKEEDIKVVRTREADIISTGDYVADIGGIYDPSRDLFDHHQEGGAGERANGVPYAAFGLVWKQYGEELTGSKDTARAVDARLVQTIDALDNGVDVLGEPNVDISYRYLLQSALNSFQPSWKEVSYSMTEAFFRALEFVEIILEREIVREQDMHEALVLVEEDYKNPEVKDDRILLLSGDYPYGRFVENNSQILFIVKPDSESDKWKVKTANHSALSFASRKLLPAEWAGKHGAELATVTGVEGARFAHNKRFIAVADTREGAIMLAKKALED